MSGFNQIGEEYGKSVGGSAVGLTLPAHPTSGDTLTPKHLLVFVHSFPIRWSAHSIPSATSGMWVPADSYINWTEPDWNYFSFIKRVRFIGIGGTATLDIIYLD